VSALARPCSGFLCSAPLCVQLLPVFPAFPVSSSFHINQLLLESSFSLHPVTPYMCSILVFMHHFVRCLQPHTKAMYDSIYLETGFNSIEGPGLKEMEQRKVGPACFCVHYVCICLRVFVPECVCVCVCVHVRTYLCVSACMCSVYLRACDFPATSLSWTGGRAFTNMLKSRHFLGLVFHGSLPPPCPVDRGMMQQMNQTRGF